MKPLRPLQFLAVALLLTGCQTALDRRTAADRETWTKLSDSDRHRLERGHVVAGDTTTAVRIAFGEPDQTLEVTRDDGSPQVIWRYDILEDGPDYSPLDPRSIPHPINRTRTVVFNRDVVANLALSPDPAIAFSPEARAGRAALFLTARLDRMVQLTRAQRRQAHTVYRQAQLQLRRLDPTDRPIKGRPIRLKMRTEIETLLTPEQRAVYDSAPPPPVDGGVLVVRN